MATNPFSFLAQPPPPAPAPPLTSLFTPPPPPPSIPGVCPPLGMPPIIASVAVTPDPSCPGSKQRFQYACTHKCVPPPSPLTAVVIGAAAAVATIGVGVTLAAGSAAVAEAIPENFSDPLPDALNELPDDGGFGGIQGSGGGTAGHAGATPAQILSGASMWKAKPRGATTMHAASRPGGIPPPPAAPPPPAVSNPGVLAALAYFFLR